MSIYLCINFMVHTCTIIGMDIMRKRFAILDISDNYSFSFISGIGDNDIYPGKWLSKYNVGFKLSFTDGVPPDGTPISIINTFKVELIVIFDTLVLLGIIFAVTCLLFNIIYRKRR